ncbi:MAG TPA: acyltransferase [Longimicrobium sp.]|uniref:acyltransferase family protein n=1 Tax=Longimicrobium sp. TaxID=2029185 RepID=UPI002EDB213A
MRRFSFPSSARILSALSRRTTSGQLIPEIDGLRFFSIALVVLFHLEGYVAQSSRVQYAVGNYENPLRYLLHRGNQGVELFFIISGFVLALPFAAHLLTGGRKVNLPAYFTRRLTRLEPPYLLAMLGTFVAMNIVRGLEWLPRVPELLAHFFYVHNWLYGKDSNISVVAWSLEIEVQWYILAPLLAPALYGIPGVWRRRAAVLGLIAAAVAGQLLVAAAGIHLPPSLLDYIQYFLVGVLLADVFLVDWRQAPAANRGWDAVWVASWAGLVWAWNQSDALCLVLFPWLALLMCMASFRGAWARRVVGNPWLAVTGGMCYTIYLLHFPIFAFVGDFTIGIGESRYFLVHYLVQVLLVVPAVLAVSAVYFLLVEKPCMDREWPAKLAARVRALRGRTEDYGRLVPAGLGNARGRRAARE